jgi:hypothetical protein
MANILRPYSSPGHTNTSVEDPGPDIRWAREQALRRLEGQDTDPLTSASPLADDDLQEHSLTVPPEVDQHGIASCTSRREVLLASITPLQIRRPASSQVSQSSSMVAPTDSWRPPFQLLPTTPLRIRGRIEDNARRNDAEVRPLSAFPQSSQCHESTQSELPTMRRFVRSRILSLEAALDRAIAETIRASIHFT